MTNFDYRADAKVQNFQLKTARVEKTGLSPQISDDAKMVPVKKNWVVMRIEVAYTGTASQTISIGDSSGAAIFLAATSSATTGTLVANIGLPKKYTADDYILLTFAGAAASSKNYTCVVYYFEDPSA